MKICAMCGTKLLNSMLPFQIAIPGANVKLIDSCGRCFLLTRINDSLQKQEVNLVELGRSKH